MAGWLHRHLSLCWVPGRYGRMLSVIQSSRTLREAMTKKGRCSVFRQRPFDVSATIGCCRVFASGQWVYRVLRKCGEKSKLAEQALIFAIKTACRKVSNLGSGRQASVFHRTSEITCR